MSVKPERVVIIDIDGLRRDVFQSAVTGGDLPNLRRIVGTGEEPTVCHVPALSTAPSITFAAQASIFTGAHPARHRVPGNECFDRLGFISNGKPRHFGFDVGDTLAVDDAIAVFRDDLADRLLNPETPTIYESGAAQGKTSLVAFNMYARGASHVIRPAITEIARFTKGKGLLGLEAGKYDAHMLEELEAAFQKADPRPDLITAYFMGLDHHSHLYGPSSQADYLRSVIDPQLGRLLDLLDSSGMIEGTLFALVSDHGQSPTPGDDAHTIRLGFPFDMELSPLFAALGLELHDLPGEDPAVDAVVGLNGGLAHVYLRHRQDEWRVHPRYTADVLPVAQAFHELNSTGKYRDELKGALDLILLRDVERNGWDAEYQVYLGEGLTRPLAEWEAEQTDLPYLDVTNRINHTASSMSGDLILVSRATEGYYFGKEGLNGVHGSLSKEDSETVLSFALPGAAPSDIVSLRNTVETLVDQRCEREGNRQPGIVDMAYLLRALWLEEDAAT